ncbi:lycopene cyclase family protein [Sphingomonas sp. MMS24-JH45]
MSASRTCDLAIVGGGLAGCLIALAVRAKRPDVRLLVIDSGEAIGGNHLWSFFDADIARDHRWLMERLVVHAWPGYDIAFPAHRRTIAQPIIRSRRSGSTRWCARRSRPTRS